MPKLPFPKLPAIRFSNPINDLKGLILGSKRTDTSIKEPGGIKTIVTIISVILMTFGTFMFSTLPATEPFKLQFSLIIFLVFIGHKFTTWSLQDGRRAKHDYISLLLFLLFDLSVVAATGRFLSPFFFSLYLMAIILAFIFNPIVSFSFLSTLIVLFSFNLGEVDLTYDFLTLLSLLTVVPITLFLRKKYLELKASRKEIVVLKSEEEKYYANVVDELLSNIITSTVANLRQPATFIKQAAYHVKDKKLSKESFDKYMGRIISASEDVLSNVQKFETETTGRKILSSFHEVAEKIEAKN